MSSMRFGSSSFIFDWKASASIRHWRGIPVNSFSRSRIDRPRSWINFVANSSIFPCGSPDGGATFFQYRVKKRTWSSSVKEVIVRANWPKRSSMAFQNWGRMVIHSWLMFVFARLSIKAKVIFWSGSEISSKLSSMTTTRPSSTADLKQLNSSSL